jgi:hypothetical protein
MNRLPRREFLLNALAACGAPFLSEVAAAQVKPKPTTTKAAPAAPKPRSITPKQGSQVAAAYFGPGEGDALQAIGTAYLKHLGVEATEEAILASAADTLQLIARAPTDAAAVTALAQAVRSDFREQRSVQLEGWIISRTEAQLCALSRLANGP